MKSEMRLGQFEQRRVSLYLGGLRESYCAGEATDRAGVLVSCGALETKSSIKARHIQINSRSFDLQYRPYIRQAQSLFATCAPRSSFAIYAEDCRERFDVPTIIKSRLISDRDAKGVLLPLDRGRHWRDLLKLREMDRPFDAKDDKLTWRGATTGVFSRTSSAEPYSSRFHLALLRDLHPDIDLGYTRIVQLERGSDICLDAISALKADGLSMAQALSSKFILCLEGNDVATGLKWMLASNSVVIMPAPTCESWFCEGELVPWEHYIPVSPTLSDLNDVYEWCRCNEGRCKEIARAGKEFVMRFLDGNRELRIAREVAMSYAESHSIVLEFSLL